MTIMSRIKSTYQRLTETTGLITIDLSQLFLRLLAAKVFLSSGLTKWNGLFQFNEEKYDLFMYEFFCPEPIREGALLLCNPETLDYEEGATIVSIIKAFALTAGVMEVLLPVLLIAGLFTRFAAIGLLAMTLFIQLAVFPEWSHWWNPAAWWAVTLLAIVATGPGRLSLDRLFGLDTGNRV
ncbi:DoxX family protein [Arenicella xantha]|uniref:Putative oxidoreductase n=1 Tax=Arenicella xantha TaxID=644221 RepID=A0A395JPH0_9GAMM|nr:DoxX family protein [Arenicella xantha]RBP53541.1 putative oxidoreductase [Arenicella xantha]